jgi:tetratricopeptide (TPR) repeat protein
LRNAISLRPGDLGSHVDLGLALRDLGRHDEAVAEFQEVVRLNPADPWGHANLGVALRVRGNYAQAAAESRRAIELAKDHFELVEQFKSELADTVSRAALEPLLPKILTGELKPKGAAEQVQFAILCYDRKRFADSARLFADALLADPTLVQLHHDFTAACAAALAGCGRGDAPPAFAMQPKLRGLALDWLRADLRLQAKQLATNEPQVRPVIARSLQHWTVDPEFAGVRELSALAALPERERNDWKSLWAEVDRVLEQARENP